MVTRDLNNREHRRYVVRAMREGLGFEVIDTCNNVDAVVSNNFTTEEAAQEWMRKHLAPLTVAGS